MSIPNEIARQHEVDDLPLWRDEEAYRVLADTVAEHGVSESVFAELVATYRAHAHKQRPRGITADFDDIFQALQAGD